MALLTINCIYTNLPGKRLPDNNLLINQLVTLSKLPEVKVAVLLNGEDCDQTIERRFFLGDHIVFYHQRERLTLGASTNFMEDHQETPYCIMMDEDDTFVDEYLTRIVKLVEFLKSIPNDALVMYAFNWWYISPNSGKLKCKPHPIIKEDGSYNMTSMISMGSAFIYNKNCPCNVKKPDLNLLEDATYYDKLWTLSGGKCYLFKDPIINYDHTASTMSKESDEQFHKSIYYILEDKEFSLLNP